MAVESTEFMHPRTCKENLHRNSHRRVLSRCDGLVQYRMQNRRGGRREAIDVVGNSSGRLRAELKYGVLIPVLPAHAV